MLPLPGAPSQYAKDDEQAVRARLQRAIDDVEIALQDLADQRGVVLKRADESRTSSATIADDDVLAAPLPANSKRLIRGTVFFDTVAAADFKWRHSGPSGAALMRLHRHSIIPGAAAYSDIAVDTAYSTTDITLVGAGTVGGVVHFNAVVHNGATAGMFAFRWAQNTSDAGVTVVRAGSMLEWFRIG